MKDTDIVTLNFKHERSRLNVSLPVQARDLRDTEKAALHFSVARGYLKTALDE